nr:hypothetical protein [Tanacetum cinerariifolium]
MVVNDQTTMHDARGMSKVNPVQIGKFLLEDGKVLTLSRKSSPSKNCIYPDQPCGLLDWCCEGLWCDGPFDGRCRRESSCIENGGLCAPAWYTVCCFPYTCKGEAVPFAGTCG